MIVTLSILVIGLVFYSWEVLSDFDELTHGVEHRFGHR